MFRGSRASVFLTVVLMVIASSAAAQDVPADFVITLERTWLSCGNECAAYSLRIDARGHVTFEGKKYVRVIGQVSDRIPVARVRELFATVERIDFFKLLDHYREIPIGNGMSVTTDHVHKSFVTVTSNGKSKRIEDYFGTPPTLRDLERQIEEVTRAQRWIRIDEATLRQLIADGNPPSAEQRMFLLKRALYSDEVDVVRTLLEIGADPNSLHDEANQQPLTIVRSAAAARTLIEAGADPLARREHGGTPMWWAPRSPPEIADVLLRAGVPADYHIDLNNTTALTEAARLGNVGVVKLLLAAGADPRREAYGRSALELARRAKADAQTHKPLVSRELMGTQPRFVEDFDGVIALLEEALAKKRR